MSVNNFSLKIILHFATIDSPLAFSKFIESTFLDGNFNADNGNAE